ncbi:TPA: amino acid permease [archaeon]|nr:amino acid permease [Candidatus Naiadarchaeales archaeon SRR2090153.bin1042]
MKKELRKYHLKRELGLVAATLSGVGIILGAGIYALIGKAAGIAGNAVWISFFFAAAVAALTGLSYAELSSMYPKAGAEYVYTEHAFNKKLAFIVGLLIIISGIIGAAAVSLGFAGYFSALFNTPLVPTAAVLIFLLSVVNYWGIKQSARIAILFTLIESFGLIAIIFIGIPYFGKVDYFEFSPVGLGGVFSAASLIFFAYLGFEEIVKLSEETKNPTKTIPTALIIAMVISTIIYILVSISAVSILGWEKLGTSSAPLADVASSALGGNAFLILSIIALFATSNTALLMMLASSRIMYGMARDHGFPEIFSRVHAIHRTPYFAVFLVMLISVLFALVGKIEVVADLTNFVAFITFIVINASVILLRQKFPKTNRHFHTPGRIGKIPILPVLGIIFSAFMLLNLGIWILIYGVVLVVISTILYNVIAKK